MRVIVCGSRNGCSPPLLERTLSGLFAAPALRPHVVISGGATGVDAQAIEWAKAHGICPVTVDACWVPHGYSGGPIRNGRMLWFEPDLVLAFPGGRGTANMVKQAREQGVEVREVLDDE